MPKSNVMLSSVNEVSELCIPLKKYGISFFSHTKIFPDGGFIDISNHSRMIEYFYYKTDMYQYYEPDMHPENFVNNFFLCSTLKDNKAVQACREILNIDHLIVIVEKVGEHHEVWNFGTDRNNDQILNFYLNNLDFLKSFILFFKERGGKLIQAYEKDKIWRPVERKILNKIDASSLDLTMPLDSKSKDVFSLNRYYLGGKFGDTYLTPSEFKILCWCVLGKSAHEISLILNSRKRTVENHIENIKLKFQCPNKLSLVQCVYEQTYLRTLINMFIK